MPITKLFNAASVRIYNTPLIKRWLTNVWYAWVTRLDTNAEAVFLNYGYAYADGKKIPLQPDDETNRYPIQLYHHVAAGAELTDKTVLEVGCGRGGGASYIARYLKPAKMIGLDICAPAIQFDQKHYTHQNNLSFIVGDAQALPLPEQSIDVVINVESSHHYQNMPQFLKEVKRVLRPGGYFLMAAIRKNHEIPLLEEQLRQSGLHKIKHEEITKNVVAALDIDSARRRRLINTIAPKILRAATDEFAAVKGSGLYTDFATGVVPYFSYIYQK